MRAGRGCGVIGGRREVSLSTVNPLFTSRLSASRRFVLRSRVCRAAAWLLALCLALDGALLAAKPLAVAATTGTAVPGCHQVASQSHADAGHATPDCCHGGSDCACATAHVLAEVARLSFVVGILPARDTVRLPNAAIALRDPAPPLRPPIA